MLSAARAPEMLRYHSVDDAGQQINDSLLTRRTLAQAQGQRPGRNEHRLITSFPVEPVRAGPSSADVLDSPERFRFSRIRPVADQHMS